MYGGNFHSVVIKAQRGKTVDIYRKNMAALATKDKELHKLITNLPDNPAYHLFKDDPKGVFNLLLMDKENTYYDIQNPLAVLQEDIDGLGLKPSKLAVFYGMGLGYEVLYFLNRYGAELRTKKIIIIEKDLYIFKKALMATDLSDVLHNKGVTLYVGKNSGEFNSDFYKFINELANKFMLKSMAIITSSRAAIFFGDYYSEIAKVFRETSHYALKEHGNCPEDSIVGERHMFLNLKYILENPGVNLLVNKFKGKPAIVCAGGPSLEKDIPLLKTVYKDFLVISAESTLFVLHKHGIMPHIACTLERVGRPDDYFDRFSEEDLKDTYLCATPVVQPAMYKNYKGPILNVYRAFGHFNWLPVQRGTYLIQASSANMAFKLAHAFGCSSIILLGQDLCFDRETNATHAEGHVYGSRQESSYNTGQLEVLANDGEMVKTTSTWKQFLDGYNIDVEEFPGEVINCSEKGAVIRGTKCMSFDEAIRKYLTQPYEPLKILRESLAVFDKSNIPNELDKTDKKIDKSLKNLDEMIRVCLDGSELCKKYIVDYTELGENKKPLPSYKKQILSQRYNEVIGHFVKIAEQSEDYGLLVSHVDQSYVISFYINLFSDSSKFDLEELEWSVAIYRHIEFYEEMAKIIETVKKCLVDAKEIVTELKKEYNCHQEVAVEA